MSRLFLLKSLLRATTFDLIAMFTPAESLNEDAMVSSQKRAFRYVEGSVLFHFFYITLTVWYIVFLFLRFRRIIRRDEYPHKSSLVGK